MNYMLDNRSITKHIYHYEQAAPSNPRPNPLHAGGGLIYALGFAGGGRFD